jgi:IS30 family transposase
MIRRGVLNNRIIQTVTTDNGCEFSHFEELEKLFKAKVYYTHAYASYEKGAIENANRLVRRWYKKGTDFNKVPRKDILALEGFINSIHRKSLNGMTSKAYCKKIAN